MDIKKTAAGDKIDPKTGMATKIVPQKDDYSDKANEVHAKVQELWPGALVYISRIDEDDALVNVDTVLEAFPDNVDRTKKLLRDSSTKGLTFTLAER